MELDRLGAGKDFRGSILKPDKEDCWRDVPLEDVGVAGDLAKKLSMEEPDPGPEPEAAIFFFGGAIFDSLH